MQNLLSAFNPNNGEFYIIVRDNGVILIEDPEELDRSGPRETLLRLFITSVEAERYLEHQRPKQKHTKVMKAVLVDLWSLLKQIDDLSKEQFEAPVRIELCAFSGKKKIFTIETMHSMYAIPN